jgi:hypothetical protein
MTCYKIKVNNNLSESKRTHMGYALQAIGLALIIRP